MHTYLSARRHSMNVRQHKATECSFNAALSLGSCSSKLWAGSSPNTFLQFQIVGRVIAEHVFDPRSGMSPI